MALQGPHQSAQKSATTRREDERTWAKWDGEVMCRIFDILVVVRGCMGGVENRKWVLEVDSKLFADHK
jgi:hypothetical protein